VSTRDPAVDIVNALIRDLCGLGGGDHFWDPIDARDKREIRRAWRTLVRAGIEGRLVRTAYGGWRAVT
jgi:hypothetical protein